MASVDEVYRDYGVVHPGDVIHPDGGTDCNVCEVIDMDYEKPSIWAVIGHMLGNIFATLFGVALIAVIAVTVYWAGYFLARGLEWKRPPMEQMWEKYSHVRIYEDGSYEGETKDGERVTGCLSGGLCNLD